MRSYSFGVSNCGAWLCSTWENCSLAVPNVNTAALLHLCQPLSAGKPDGRQYTSTAGTGAEKPPKLWTRVLAAAPGTEAIAALNQGRRDDQSTGTRFYAVQHPVHSATNSHHCVHRHTIPNPSPQTLSRILKLNLTTTLTLNLTVTPTRTVTIQTLTLTLMPSPEKP